MKILILFLCLFSSFAFAGKDWNGKKAAVSLTYDDGLGVHIDNAMRELDKYGFKGTFYVTVSTDPFKNRIEEWRAMAANGHELGNHTMHHPCDGSSPGREWVAEANDLSKWSVDRMVNNIAMTNVLLEAVDGKKQRTFAYTCGDMKAGGESFVERIKPMFPGARGVQNGYPKIKEVDIYNIPSFMIMNDSAEQLTARVDEAIAKGALVVFLFHGVGGEHGLDVSKEAHDALIAYLDKRKKDVWVAPMIDIVEHIESK